VRVIPAFLSIMLVTFLFAAGDCSAAAWPPTLTIIDEGGTPHTGSDNMTIVTTSPGGRFTVEVEGKIDHRFAVAFSLTSTGATTGLFLVPPFVYLLPGSANYLDSNGMASFPVTVPRGFVTSDLDLYIQAAVFETTSYTLTNAITLEILVPSVNADLAVHFGPHPGAGQGLNAITEIGRLDDDMAEDNVVNGSGVTNGEAITQAPDFAGEVLAYMDQGTPVDRYPIPSNSIFLNGRSYLVPGDTGLHPDFDYPRRGSQMGIYSRNAVCRNMENPAVQHIVIPPIAGGLSEDLNLYHVKLNTTPSSPSWGFATLNVETNEYTVLSGTVTEFNPLVDVDDVSPWDANVAISPDRKIMAAIRKIRGVFGGEDELHLIRLDNTTWPSTGTADKHILVEVTGTSQKDPELLFAETLTFLETDQAGEFMIYFATNYRAATGGQDPPKAAISSLWRYSTALATNKAKQIDSQYVMPTTGNGFQPKFIGTTYQYSVSGFPTDPQISNARWIKSKDNRTLCIAIAGRNIDTDPWEWDMFSFTDALASGSETIRNISQFKVTLREILPFGRCTDGECKVAISDDGSMVAFVAREVAMEDEDLYFYRTDGGDVGRAGLLSTGVIDLDIQADTHQVVEDPCIMDNGDALFFAGMRSPASGSINTDLFLYDQFNDDYVNVTNTSSQAYPPFTKIGSVLPGGYFLTEDSDKMYFFRGMMVGQKKQMNLVGVDLLNDYELFSCTGDEFNGGVEIVPDIAIEDGMGLEHMSLVYCSSPDPECLVFMARFTDSPAPSYQVFRLDMANPFAALPITSFDPAVLGFLDNIVADETGMMVAFSRSNAAGANSKISEKIFAVDVASFCYTRDLTPDNDYDLASVDGSFRFIPGNTLPPDMLSPQLVYAYGLGVGGASNPFPARAWVFPLNTISNSSISHPLTSEGSVFVYNAIP
jgi:hypothetical protein